MYRLSINLCAWIQAIYQQLVAFRCKSARVQGNCCPTDEGVSCTRRIMINDWSWGLRCHWRLTCLNKSLLHFLWLYRFGYTKKLVIILILSLDLDEEKLARCQLFCFFLSLFVHDPLLVEFYDFYYLIIQFPSHVTVSITWFEHIKEYPPR